ncbi:MAG: DinB family protein [Pseudomonadota bacterium]|nr:DinB family protein [Pseudomonadota bacterium]
MSNITAAGSPEIDELVHENTRVLAQLAQLVGRLAPEPYQRSLGPQGQHAIGKHVRHIVNHYESFLSGITGDAGGTRVDYEHRLRDPVIESDPAAACLRLAGLSAALERLSPRFAREALQLNHPTASKAIAIHSSAGRELVFLFSHTIHHMAIIGLLAEQLGVVAGSEFGVHPSTLLHWQREATKLARSA